MVRRTIAAFIGCMLLAACLLPARAAADGSELRIEQVQVEMPEVRAYFHYAGEPQQADVTATLGSRALEVTELRRYDETLDATSYFFLVDCSTSTSAGQMAATKTALMNFARDMGDNANVTLIAFGVEVEVLLQREKDRALIEDTIGTLRADKSGTVFFDALAAAIDLASNQAYALERKLAFVFSDAVDYNVGGYTKEEIDALLISAGMPFYAIGFDTGTKEQLDNFGALARASGGQIEVVSAATLPNRFRSMLDTAHSAWLASFDAGTNIADIGVQEFSLSLAASGQSAVRQVPVRHWRADDAAPFITGVTQQTPESILIAFSEAVSGASSVESYAVTNATGDLLGIRAVTYDEAARSALLTLSDAAPTGAYTLSCPGITDVSMEKNRLAALFDFELEGAAETPEEPDESAISPLIWVALGLIVVVIIIAVVSSSGRKKREAEREAQPAATGAPQRYTIDQPQSGGEEVQVHFQKSAAPLPKIKLQVTSPSGEGRLVEIPVNKTLFVGRSDICDVRFDDAGMSRQHFVIAEEDGLFTITNLSETGGTMLNGVTLQNPRPLHNGDTIRAGGQEIIVLLPGQ